MNKPVAVNLNLRKEAETSFRHTEGPFANIHQSMERWTTGEKDCETCPDADENSRKRTID